MLGVQNLTEVKEEEENKKSNNANPTQLLHHTWTPTCGNLNLDLSIPCHNGIYIYMLGYIGC